MHNNRREISPWWALVVIAIVFALLACFEMFARPALGSEYDASVVFVTCGHNSAGTGTLVWSDGQEGLILTAAHVIETSAESATHHENVAATWADGTQSPGRVIYYDRENDAAAFLVKVHDAATPLPLANEKMPGPGDTVDAVGFGGGYGVKPLRVIGYGKQGASAFPDWLMADQGVRSGDSGGPFVYQQTVCGVISGGQTKGPHGPMINSQGGNARAIRKALGRVFPRINHQTTQCPPGTYCPTYPPRAIQRPLQRRTPPVTQTQPPTTNLQLLIGRIENLERKTVDLAPYVERLDDLEKRIDGIEIIQGPPGPPGADGKDGQNAPGVDPAAIVGELIERIKTDPQLQEALRGPPGRDGKDGRDGIDGKDGGDALPPSTGVSHAVVVVDRNATYWARLATQIERARNRFHPIRIDDDPPNFGTQLPAIVFYDGGKPIYWKYGERDVTRTLEALQRGDVDFLTSGM